MSSHASVHSVRRTGLPTAAAVALLACCSTGAGLRACPPSDPPIGRCGTPDVQPSAADTGPVIQLAILLDTSGSMEGLINQARSRIWDVVNDLSKARRDGRKARLEVALYQYGSDRLPSSCEGYLRLVQPFTTDLDLLSEQLFALSVGGSAEYAGWAMQSGLRELAWDRTPTTRPLAQQPLRVMVVAGNEPFTQGPVDYVFQAEAARSRGVIVNTVYCGRAEEGSSTGWADAAARGAGRYLVIDKDAAIPYSRCPQDDELMRLNADLNTTYVPYGGLGEQFRARQLAQDAANRRLSVEGAVARTAAKASGAYSNTHWDLVDAVEADKADIAALPTESLPPPLRPMTIDERKEEIKRLSDRREQIKERIRQLAAERERLLAERRACGDRRESLGSVMITAMREQAGRLGFSFDPD